MIKKHLEKYLLDYELHCFEEAWKDLNSDIKRVVIRLTEGIEDTFAKKVGQLNFQNRRVKLLKYLEKK